MNDLSDPVILHGFADAFRVIDAGARKHVRFSFGGVVTSAVHAKLWKR
jgi:hypothetical protein